MARKLFFTVFAGLVLWAGLAAPLSGQEERSASSTDRLTGKVEKVDKAKSTIVVAYNNVRRDVVYGESTRFTVHNQPGTLDAVKEGIQVICRGKFDWRNRLIATRIEVPGQDE